MGGGDFRPGGRFGSLELIREIGRGAFGRVWLARDPSAAREVALKVVPLPRLGDTEGERDRVLREARLMGRMQHAHIATLYHVHPLPDDDGWVLELEYLPGGTLQERLRAQGALPRDEARRTLVGVLSALAASHEAAVVHGDVKPANVLYDAHGVAKLLDFGLARPSGEISLRSIGTGGWGGTLRYMAPEVLQGDPPSHVSDLWSLGVVAYETVTGRPPFPTDNYSALWLAVVNGAPAPLPPDIPADLRAVIERCLRRDPSERAADPAALIALLTGETPPPPAPVARAAPEPRLLGRRGERARLLALASDAAEGRRRCVVVSGEAGMGKSALAAHLREATAERGFRWIDAAASEVGGVLRPLLVGLESTTGTPVGPGAAAPEAADAQPGAWAQRLEETLRGLARRAPCGLLVDDAHRLGARDRGLVLELARRLAHERLLVVLLFRTHDPGTPADDAAATRALEEWTTDPAVEHVPLAPLPDGTLARILAERSGGAYLEPGIPEHVLAVGEGNPLFALEVLHHLQETGAIHREGGAWRRGPRWGEITLPHHLRDLVALRVGDLHEHDRGLLDVAAVDGAEFDGEALAAVTGSTLLEVLRGLQRIVRRTGLIVPRPRGFRFANGVVREAVREDLAPDLRRELHRRLARHLEERSGKEEVEPARLAFHWERAGEAGRARPWFERAAALAAHREEAEHALDYAERAGLLEPSALEDAGADAARGRLLLQVARALGMLGRGAEAERLRGEVAAFAERIADRELIDRTWVERLELALAEGRPPGGSSGEIEARVAALPDGPPAARALLALAGAAIHRREIDRASGLVERAHAMAERLGREGERTEAIEKRAVIAGIRGDHERAAALHAEAARLRAASGRPNEYLVSELNRMIDEFELGRFDECRGPFEECARTLLVRGARVEAAHAFAHLASIELGYGHAERAAGLLDEAIDTLRGTANPTVWEFALQERALLRAMQGRLDEARHDLAQARERGAGSASLLGAVRRTCVAAQIHCYLDETAEAARIAERVARRAREASAPGVFAVPLVLLAQAAVHGLPGRALREAIDATWPGGEPSEVDGRYPWRFCEGVARLLRDDDAGDAVQAAVEAARGSKVSAHRRTVEGVGEWIGARAARRAGRAPEALAHLERAASVARGLGYVWLELACVHERTALTGSPDARADRDRLLDRIGEGIADDATRERVRAAWSRPRA